MAPPRPPRVRDRQRGNTMLIALVVLSALATLASLTVVSVQSSLKTSTNDRAQAIAMYAAESGAAVAMDFLRNNFDSNSGWSQFVTSRNQSIRIAMIPGNDVPPEDPSSLFTKDQNAWFDIRLLNNRDDPGYSLPDNFVTPDNDQDGQIIIHSTGHGPQGSLAIIEWEVRRLPACTPTTVVPAWSTFPPPPPSPPPPCGLPLPALPSDAPPGSQWGPVPTTQPLILLGWHIATPL